MRAGYGRADPHHDQRHASPASSPSRSRAWADSSRRPRNISRSSRSIVRNHGGIFISDEVQTGWGRTGGKWFGIEQWGVTPDIITSAKGLGNGSPIGLTVAQARGGRLRQGADHFHFRRQSRDRHRRPKPSSISSKSRTCWPTAPRPAPTCATGLEDLQGQARDHRRRARHGPAAGHRAGGGPRDESARPPLQTAMAMEAARENRLLLGKGGMYGNVLRISPPMNIGRADVDQFIEAARQAAWRPAARWRRGASSELRRSPDCAQPGALSRTAPGARFAIRAGGSQPLPVLLRRALHGRLSHSHRRARASSRRSPAATCAARRSPSWTPIFWA